MSKSSTTEQPIRQSAIQRWLEARQAQWRLCGQMPIATRLKDDQAELAAIRTLALCDLSALPKLGLRGPGAAKWLSDEGLDVPTEIYQSSRLADGGCLVRLAADEFLLEGDLTHSTVPQLDARLNEAAAGVLRVPREEATFLLIGSKALDVLAQTCGIDLRRAPHQHLVLTRVAGVSCGVFPDPLGDHWACRLWVDYTYALYLWETIQQICEELGGCVVGAGCIFGELQP